MTPDAPGWWWLTGGNGPSPVEVTIEGGALLYRSGLWPHPVASVLPGHWLGPVAPPGSVAPAEHAWAVRDAYLSDWIDGFPDHGWGGSAPRSDLIARVGADVVAQVER